MKTGWCSPTLLFLVAAFELAQATDYHFLPEGAGSGTGTNFGNALAWSDFSESEISTLLNVTMQPGDRLLMGSGIYEGRKITIASDGEPGNRKAIVGIDTGDGPPLIVKGSWSRDAPDQGNHSLIAFSGNGVAHWEVSGLELRGAQYAVHITDQSAAHEDIILSGVRISDVRHGIYIHDLHDSLLEDISIVEYTKHAFRLEKGCSFVQFIGCTADLSNGDDSWWDYSEPIPFGFNILGTASEPNSNLIFIDCQARNNRRNGQGPTDYWNGDGFSMEGNNTDTILNTDIVFHGCRAYDNDDAGFDIKPEAHFIDCVSFRNKRNFRQWFGHPIFVNCVAGYSGRRGGSGSQDGFWFSKDSNPNLNYCSIHGNDGNAIHMQSGGEGFATAENSILSFTGGDGTFTVGAVDLEASTSSWRPGEGTDPGFVDDTILWEGTGNNFDSQTYGATKGYNSANTRIYTPILINELDSVTQSGDTREFIELFDGGSGNTVLDGLVLVLYDGDLDTSYHAIDLDGHSTDNDGYFVAGNSAVVGVDIVFPDGTLRNGPAAAAIYRGDASEFPNGTAITTAGLVEAVGYGFGQAHDAGLLALLISGSPQLDEAVANGVFGHSMQRFPNGSGSPRDTLGFAVFSATPGEANTLPPPPQNIDLDSFTDTGVSQTDNITNNTNPSVRGTCRPGASIEVFSDLDGSVATFNSNSNGDWAQIFSLSEGVHQVTATADGSAPSSALTITIDTTGPAPTIAKAVGQDDPAAEGPVRFSVDFGEDVSGFDSGVVTVSGSATGSVSVTGGTSVYDIGVSASGEGYVTVAVAAGVVTDLAGNTNIPSASADNRVDLDSDSGVGGTPTVLAVISGAASFSGYLHQGDIDAFQFTLAETHEIVIYTTGPTDTVGILKDSSGTTVNAPGADDDAGEDLNFRIAERLPSGEYEILIYSPASKNRSTSLLKNEVGSYELSVTANGITDDPLICPHIALKSQLARKIKKLKAKAKKVKKKGDTSKARKLKQKTKKLAKQLRNLIC